MSVAMIPEPWRVKVVEPISVPTPAEREEHLRKAGFNLFAIPSEGVFIDLCTDSGTSAMSDRQWAGLVQGDESYAGARSFFRLESAIREIFGLPHVIPVHQGRAAENLLFSEIVEPGMVIPNNTHFDTTRANIEVRGGIAQDLGVAEAADPSLELPFKGDIDLVLLERLLSSSSRAQIPAVLLTLTNNAAGGQPVSLANIRGCAALCREHGVPLYLDAARFAENAYLIQQREEGQEERSVAEIVREIFSLVDGCLVSAKKDGLVNIGGFLALRDESLAERLKQRLVVHEGFPTYGGMAGRDLEAMAQGLREVLDESYLRFRVHQLSWFGEELKARGIPTVRPVGGHAVYLDAKSFLPSIPQDLFPGQALTVALYRFGAIRGVEIGTVMFGRVEEGTGRLVPPALELVRLAIPRRVYTHSHLLYVAEVLSQIRDRREEIRGLRMTHQPPVLRHFSARFEELEPALA